MKRNTLITLIAQQTAALACIGVRSAGKGFDGNFLQGLRQIPSK